MTEEEKMVFWGDLVEPITALLGGLLVRGEYKLVDVVKDIVDKAENAALEEREACAQIAHNTYEGFGVDAKGVDFVKQQIIRQIKERGQSEVS
jgi:hypothetical protein